MEKIKRKLLKFMEGRYGADELFYILTVLYIVMVFSNILFRSWVLHILSLVVFAVAVCRTLSRNIPKRSRENAWVLGRVKGVRKKYVSAQKRKAQRDEYYFMKCPGCKKRLRFPRKVGMHNAKCPACGKEFKVNIKK